MYFDFENILYEGFFCFVSCKRVLSLARKLAARLLSLRWSEKIFPRSLSVSLPRATLVAWWTQSAYKQHLFLDYFATLVMTKKQNRRTAQGTSHDLVFSGFAKNFFFGGDPARSCEGRTVPSKPPLPWPTLLQLNLKCTLILKIFFTRDFFALSLASEFCHSLENLPHASCHCDGVKRFFREA